MQTNTVGNGEAKGPNKDVIDHWAQPSETDHTQMRKNCQAKNDGTPIMECDSLHFHLIKALHFHTFMCSTVLGEQYQISPTNKLIVRSPPYSATPAGCQTSENNGFLGVEIP